MLDSTDPWRNGSLVWKAVRLVLENFVVVPGDERLDEVSGQATTEIVSGRAFQKRAEPKEAK